MEDICETGLRLKDLIREDLKVQPFVNVITKVALSPQIFKDPDCWSGRNRTHDLSHGSPVLNQLSHRCAVIVLMQTVIIEWSVR